MGTLLIFGHTLINGVPQSSAFSVVPFVFSIPAPSLLKVDLWSLGTVVYTMLTGTPLYGGSRPEIFKRKAEGKVLLQ